MTQHIPHTRLELGPEAEQAVVACLRSGYLSCGPRVAEFETAFASFCHTPAAVGLASGTAALHLALLVLGVGRGDSVLVPDYVCSAVTNAVRQAGARPLLVDAVPGGYTLDPAQAARRVTSRTKAVIAAHLFGEPADIAGLRRALPGLPIIEDATQAPGAWAGQHPVGSLGDVATFSFYATKPLCAGAGGMLVGPPHLVEAARDRAEYDNRDDSTERFSYLMTDLTASLGLNQLSRYTETTARRRLLARRYIDVLRDVVAPGQLPAQPDPVETERPPHVYYRFAVAGQDSDEVCRRCNAAGVEAKRPVYRPLHQQLGQAAHRFPESERAHRTIVSLPLYPALTDDEAWRVVEVAREALAT